MWAFKFGNKFQILQSGNKLFQYQGLFISKRPFLNCDRIIIFVQIPKMPFMYP
ncbi:hypothetical protein Hanom_Chr06g00516101 [Helianthus anomalus]